MNEWDRLHRIAEHYKAEYPSGTRIMLLSMGEDMQKGKITLIKHCDDGSTQIETPEVGAEFAVFLKSSGSYDSATVSEKDYLVCDENGYAETKLLPYGVYTVRQTKGWDGRELMKDFDVFINKDGGVYRYLINNAPFTSYVKVIKTDAETGNSAYSVEFVSPICKYEDIGTIQELIRKLRSAGAKVNSSCGIHIHIDASPHDVKTLRNIVNIMAAKEDLLYKSLKVDVHREHYCAKADTRLYEWNSNCRKRM